MSQPSGSEVAPNPLADTNGLSISKETPFSLVWLAAVDPRTFTPQTWENGRETNIRLRAKDGSIRVNVSRIISHYIDGEVGLKDEMYALRPGGTEAGDQEVSQLSYTFDTDGCLTGFDPTPDLTENMQKVVSILSGLVTIMGSTIQASNYRTGPESSFVSDGAQWIEARTGIAAPTRPMFFAGRLALGQSVIE